MNLLVANFDCQSIVSVDQVVRAVRTLPYRHVNGIQVIRYDPRRAIPTTLSYMGNQVPMVSSRGMFFHDRDTSVIVLFYFESTGSFYHVLYHEIGHYVFLKYLSQAQRDQWMYGVRMDEKAYVTPYASRNSREDFAETYAVFCTSADTLKSFPKRFDFMNRQVFPAA